jgi:predicted metalloprotease
MAGNTPDARGPGPRRAAPERTRFGFWLAVCGALAGCSTDGKAIDRFAAEPESRRAALSARASEAALGALVNRVVKDVDDYWARDFKRRGKDYVMATAVLFSERSAAHCGAPSAIADPNCRDPHSVFIDLDFLRALSARFGEEDARAPQVYVVAHAMGHHIQRVLGLDGEVQKLLATRPVATHAVELQLELQADCLAGVWARVTAQKDLLDRARIERALHQASELGTERVLAQKRDEPDGESFTYAVPRRRLYWFGQGYAKAQVQDCDTFSQE